jgi:hypothetical protein
MGNNLTDHEAHQCKAINRDLQDVRLKPRYHRLIKLAMRYCAHSCKKLFGCKRTIAAQV